MRAGTGGCEATTVGAFHVLAYADDPNPLEPNAEPNELPAWPPNDDPNDFPVLNADGAGHADADVLLVDAA